MAEFVLLRVWFGFISSLSYTACHTKFKDPNLPNNLPVAGKRIVGYILFLEVLTMCKIQTASFRILAKSIS